MKQIQITNINRFTTYVEVGFIFTFEVPTQFVGLSNTLQIAKSYSGNYDIITGETGNVFTFTSTQSFDIDATKNFIQQSLIDAWAAGNTELNSFVLKDYDSLIDANFDGTNWS